MKNEEEERKRATEEESMRKRKRNEEEEIKKREEESEGMRLTRSKKYQQIIEQINSSRGPGLEKVHQ